MGGKVLMCKAGYWKVVLLFLYFSPQFSSLMFIKFGDLKLKDPSWNLIWKIPYFWKIDRQLSAGCLLSKPK